MSARLNRYTYTLKPVKLENVELELVFKFAEISVLQLKA